MFAEYLKCGSCGTAYSLGDKSILCSACGGVFIVEYDLDNVRVRFNRELLKNRVRSMWRYRELMPIARKEHIVSLGEGCTSLVSALRYERVVGLSSLRLKLDFLNPTGSFKDRGTSVSVSSLKGLEIKRTTDDSSGNAAASLAAYCAAAGIGCVLYVPAAAPSEKLLQAEIYGAEIRKISGSRSDAAEAAQASWKSEGVYYASHNLSPFFLEGMKTLAYEITEDSGWKVPDHVVFPVGGGALIVGAWRGFRDLLELGWIDRIPKLHCIQSEACMPIVRAFRDGDSHVRPVVEKDTVAGGIRIANPGRGDQVLESIRDTKGVAVSVTDDQILMHMKLLARSEGIFVEPTSCAALAGLAGLRQAGAVQEDESVIVPLTGFGLKDTATASLALTFT